MSTEMQLALEAFELLLHQTVFQGQGESYLSRLREVFPNEDDRMVWLRTPHPVLWERSPIQLPLLARLEREELNAFLAGAYMMSLNAALDFEVRLRRPNPAFPPG